MQSLPLEGFVLQHMHLQCLIKKLDEKICFISIFNGSLLLGIHFAAYVSQFLHLSRSLQI